MNCQVHSAFILILMAISMVYSCGEKYVDFDPLAKDGILERTRTRRSAPIRETRKACQVGDQLPKTRIDTTQRLAKLRQKMQELELDALLVPSGDAHQSEYVASADKRRQWISGFSGSSGFAVVTLKRAATWTDGRYFLQAEDELDCNWHFMKGEEGNDNVASDWLSEELQPGAKVGADPALTGAPTWLEWDENLGSKGYVLVPLERNPIDEVWDDVPARSNSQLEVHDVKYAGKSWPEKVEMLREKLAEKKTDATVVTALDEVAWLFNLRGRDIPYNPVFRAYAVVDTEEIVLYIDRNKQTRPIKEHLKTEGCDSANCVKIRDYETIFDELEGMSEKWSSVLLGKKYAYTGGVSYAIYRLIPGAKRRLEISPVLLMKAAKNEAEIRGMKSANIRDAVALIEFADTIERGMANGEDWDELKASEELGRLRRAQDLNRGLSFETISAYGPNGAVIHYKPTNVSNAKIGRDAFFLLDSGGQYVDGTTDVTRTFHYGQPSDFEREVYTRVLMGSIDLARVTFVEGTPDTRLDILARWNLFEAGLNYRHGTGHGIGAYGFIHESPVQVRVYAKEEHPMREGYFFSDEPGYYEAGVGGVRLETVLRAVDATPRLPYSAKKYGKFLAFEPVCLVPFEPKLTDYDLLTSDHVEWLDEYNKMIRDQVGPELLRQNKKTAFNWMMARTEPRNGRQPRQQRSSGTSFRPRALAMILLILGVKITLSQML